MHLLALLLTGMFVVVAAGGDARAQAIVAQASPAQAAVGHPADDYDRAASLFAAGRRDEATYLFYRGQLRYRIHLAARPGLPPDGDPALFAALSESVGRPINEWAFGDVPALVATLDRVLAWHAANDDGFTPKSAFPAAHRDIRRGLEGLRADIARSRDTIRAERRANGLTNRN